MVAEEDEKLAVILFVEKKSTANQRQEHPVGFKKIVVKRPSIGSRM